MTNEERAEKLFHMNEYIKKMQSALYGQRVMWVVAKNLGDENWMERIELFAATLKEKIITTQKEYELLFAGDCGIQSNMFEGGVNEEANQNNAGSVAANCN